MEHCATCTLSLVYILQESAEVPNLQTESNFLDSFKFYCIFTDLSPQLWGRGQVGWGYMGAWGYPHMHTHTHAHAHMHTHAYLKKLQMAANMFIMIVVWSLWSPCSPHFPHIIPVILMSSPHNPCYPNIVPKPPFNPLPHHPLPRGTLRNSNNSIKN